MDGTPIDRREQLMARTGLPRILTILVLTIAVAGCGTTPSPTPVSASAQPTPVATLASTPEPTPSPQPSAEPAATAGPTPSAAPTASPAASPGAATVAKSDVPRASAPPSAAPRAATAIRAFGLDLYRRVARQDGNVVLSPTSIAIALAMARAGARGATATQMDSVMRKAGAPQLADAMNALDAALATRTGTFEGPDGAPLKVILRIANATFLQRDMPVEPAFLDALAARFGSGVRLVDYEADPEASRETINAWVNDRTGARIPKLLAPGDVTSLTRFALVNAIYLRAPWLDAFQARDTTQARFTLADGSRVRVPTMHLVSTGLGPNYPVAVGSGWRAIRMPYVGEGYEGGLAMTMIVPDDLVAFERRLTPALLAKLTNLKRDGGLLHYKKVDLALPRFSIESRVDLKTALSTLGMPVAFDPDRANFRGIATLPNGLYVAKVIHQANIDVDEKGTEAAAATAVVGVTGGPGDTSKPIVIHADRPFLFVLTDVPTGAILFMGRVADPSVR